jgi:MATE family multidrug resistance protein
MEEFSSMDAGPRVIGHGRKAWVAEGRALLVLALPLSATQIAQMLIVSTDTFMLGHLSTTALAAATLGNTVFLFVWLLGSGSGMAVSPMIAHILGRAPNDVVGVRACVRMGFWSVALLSIPLIGLLLCTRPLLLALGQEPMLAADAARFINALLFGLPFALGFQVLRNFATALSKPVAPLIVMGLAIFFNALGDYTLIFGHFGVPRLGLTGAGLSSASSFAFSFFAMLAVVAATPALRRYRIFRRSHRPDMARLIEVFRLGLPIGLTMAFEIMLFNAATLIMGGFGVDALAAHQIALMIPSLTFMVPLGIGMAATVRVGLAAGANDREGVRRAGYGAMAMAACFMACMSLVLVAFPRPIASVWFANPAANAAVIALTTSFLYVAAAFQVADGLQVTASLTLRGLKDARAPMWIAGASYWLAGFPACLLLAYHFHLRGLGVWYGLAFSLFVAAAGLIARFYVLARD